MSEIKNILEEAAKEYSAQFWGEEKRNANTDFKKGAEWQKEQDKNLVDAIESLLKNMFIHHADWYPDEIEMIKIALNKYRNS